MITNSQKRASKIWLMVQAELRARCWETSQYYVVETTGLIQPDCALAAIFLKTGPGRNETLQPSSDPINAAVGGISIDSAKKTKSLMRPINAHQQFLNREQKQVVNFMRATYRSQGTCWGKLQMLNKQWAYLANLAWVWAWHSSWYLVICSGMTRPMASFSFCRGSFSRPP